jgi:polysaccharide biosynthesis transport protein
LELKDYLRALRIRWFIVVVFTLAGVLLGAGATLASPRVYEASTELFVAPEGGTTSSELVQGSSFVLGRVKSYVRVIDRELVLGPAIEELDLDQTVPELSEDVSAYVVEETVVVVVTARSGDAEEAARIADGVAAEFVRVAPSLEPQPADDRGVVRITVIEPASVPSAPISPRPVLNLALGLLVGLTAGVAGAVVLQALDRRVRTESDVRELTSAPVMGYVPADPTAPDNPLITHNAQRSVRAEALRQVRTNLQFLDLPVDRRSFVVTSSMPAEGKTLTAINLALTLAQAGQRVCFVEADLRRPKAAEYLHLEGVVGLTNALLGSVQWSDVTQPYAANLDVLLAGVIPPNPSELLASAAMDNVLHGLEDAYDVLVVDAPPLLPVTDAAILAKRCSGAIVVVGFGRRAVSRQDLSASLEILSTVDARLLGVVLNRVPMKGLHGRATTYELYDTEPTRAPDADKTRSRRHSTAPAERRSDRHAGRDRLPLFLPVSRGGLRKGRRGPRIRRRAPEGGTP